MHEQHHEFHLLDNAKVGFGSCMALTVSLGEFTRVPLCAIAGCKLSAFPFPM